MRTIITTVGTSLLTNRDNRPWAGWRFGNVPPNPLTIANWLASADPHRASAEIHTWHKLGVLDETAEEKVVLVHSQTPDGKFCAEQLQKYAERKRLKAEIRQVNELSYTNAETFNRGLSRLVRVLAETIRAGRSQGEVVIAATGGFKAEIAIANLVGALLGAPVYYIYEQFEHLIKLEPIPVALAPEWLREGVGKALLQKLASGEDCLPRHEVDSLLKADGRLEMLLESAEIDGVEIVCSNVLGEFAVQLLETPMVDWPSACDTLPEEKIKLEGAAHHRPRGWERVVNRLAQSRMVRLIRFDSLAGGQQGIRLTRDDTTALHVVIVGKDDAGRDNVLGLRVETTAQGAEQRRLVLDHLRQQVNL